MRTRSRLGPEKDACSVMTAELMNRPSTTAPVEEPWCPKQVAEPPSFQLMIDAGGYLIVAGAEQTTMRKQVIDILENGQDQKAT